MQKQTVHKIESKHTKQENKHKKTFLCTSFGKQHAVRIGRRNSMCGINELHKHFSMSTALMNFISEYGEVPYVSCFFA